MRTFLFTALALAACSIPAKVAGDAGLAPDGDPGLGPDTTLTAMPPADSKSTTATFAFTSPLAGAGFECSLDADTFRTCSSPSTTPALADGGHEFRVRAVAPGGAADPTPASFDWIVDTTPPDTSITSGPPSTNQVGMATFELSGSPDTVSYQCSLDGAPYATCASPYQRWIDDGAHSLSVRAIDGAGNVDQTPFTWSWTNQLANLVFVTNDTTWNTDLGGLSGADQICAANASAAGLHGAYVAWLSTSKVDAIDRLGPARGWVRLDGKPFVDTTAQLAAGQIFYPIALDASGAPVPALTQVRTGTNSAGRFDTSFDACQDWTSGTGYGVLGYSDAGTGRWTFDQHLSAACGAGAVHLYCFGVDRTQPVVAPVAPGARLAFLSTGTWTPGGGLTSADALCTSEATAAGDSGMFRALLGTSTTNATARFTMTGPPWARRDGVLVVPTAAALFDTQRTDLDAPIDVSASGVYVEDQSPTGYAWSSPLASTALWTCNDWMSSSFQSSGTAGDLALTLISWSFGESVLHCNLAEHIYCLQQ
jgi:hypothetical protein